MKKLYVPNRSAYATSVRDTVNRSPDECPFCTQGAQDRDEQNFIFKRFGDCMVMLNLYPYNAGHLLILPREHKAELHQLSAHTRNLLMELTSASVNIVQDVLGAHGVNIGINIGRAAGAGIPSHLHIHVLPRWNGDTNFLPLLAETKTISFDLKEMYKRLKPHFDALSFE